MMMMMRMLPHGDVATGVTLLVVVASLRCVSCGSHDVCSRSYSLHPSYLGLNYEVLLWPPDGHDESEASFSVSALTSTDVRVQFPSSSSSPPADCLIMFSGVRLDCGQTIHFTLVDTETVTFTSMTTDLSGTLVDASMPVAVYAKNSRVTIGPSNVTDDTSEQLFPVTAWGRQFVVAPVPGNNQSGYALRLTSGTGVNVSVDVAGTVHELQARWPLTVDFPDNRPAYVNVTGEDAAATVQLMQFVRGATLAADSGAPAALVVPSVDRFSNVYTLTADDEFFDSMYSEYVSVVVRRSDVSGLRLNAADLYASWTDVGYEDWVTGAVRLRASKYFTLQHAGNQPFGAYSYGYNRGHCAYAHPAGASLPTHVIPSLM